jgi:hypothetical protein
MPSFRVLCFKAGELDGDPREVKTEDEHAAAEQVCGGPLVEGANQGSFALKYRQHPGPARRRCSTSEPDTMPEVPSPDWLSYSAELFWRWWVFWTKDAESVRSFFVIVGGGVGGGIGLGLLWWRTKNVHRQTEAALSPPRLRVVTRHR